MSFEKVLIANRGEIAARVIRSARGLGYRTVAVHSDADAGALHTREADEAVRIGPAAAAESYLSIDAVLAAATATGADAIHPGYGFLAENPAFADACAEAGVTFIGPPADAIRAMGDKASAKARMNEAGVPTVPGYFGDAQDDARLVKEAEAVGYPLLVKAVSGGGGRGMRLVRDASQLPDAIEGARREAKSAFGDDTLMLERFVDGGRHIEIQVFADTHGNVIHLGERDCTAQRRRQKVIEEAPSPVVDDALRAKMGADAVRAAQAIGYVGAGTVELIVGADLAYFFLEMNTRLQVEHPVTEMVTGQDLVAWQLRVAAGEPLPITQDDVRLDGHAIEARLYAEDPYAGFAPQVGPVRVFTPDAITSRAGVRVDTGIAQGDEVTPFYDPMVAKVIAHGRDRDEARRRLALALEDLPLFGLVTNRRFLAHLLRSDAFASADMTVGTLDAWNEEGAPIVTRPEPSDHGWALAAALIGDAGGEWFRNVSPVELTLSLDAGGEARALRVRREAPGCVSVHGASVDEDGEGLELTVELAGRDAQTVRYVIDDVERRARYLRDGDALLLDLGDGSFRFEEASPYPEEASFDDPSEVRSPVAGTVVRLEAGVGDAVEKEATVAVVEAMKMETRLVAARDGVVSVVHLAVGEQIEAGGLVLSLADTEEGETDG